MKNTNKKTVTKTVTTEEKEISFLGFKKQVKTTTRVIETALEAAPEKVKKNLTTKQIENIVEGVYRRAVLRQHTDAGRHAEAISPKMKKRFQFLLKKGISGYLNFIPGIAYGVGATGLANILTGTGSVDVNVLIFLASVAAITISGLVKVFFDVQFKDSG
jgi:hypothetical protein